MPHAAGAGIRSLASRYTGLIRSSTCDKRLDLLKQQLYSDFTDSTIVRRMLEAQISELEQSLHILRKSSLEDKQQFTDYIDKLTVELDRAGKSSTPWEDVQQRLRKSITGLSQHIVAAKAHAIRQIADLSAVASSVKDGLARLSPGKKLYNAANRALSPGKKLYNAANHALSPGKKLYNAANRAFSPGKKLYNAVHRVVSPKLMMDLRGGKSTSKRRGVDQFETMRIHRSSKKGV